MKNCHSVKGEEMNRKKEIINFWKIFRLRSVHGLDKMLLIGNEQSNHDDA